MINPYQLQPEFIDLDPRRHRMWQKGLGYTVDQEFMHIRHECFLEGLSLEGKTVLDLGSCIGYSGSWSLLNGAKFYQGVEFSKDLADISINLLDKYFDKSTWNIKVESIEDFLKNNINNYDVVIASGVIYSFYNPIPFLDNLANIANTIIIESIQPKQPNIDTDTASFITFDSRRMMIGTDNKNIFYNGSLPSSTFISNHLEMFGFQRNIIAEQSIRAKLPNRYNSSARFLIRCTKETSQSTPRGFIQAMQTSHPSVFYEDW